MIETIQRVSRIKEGETDRANCVIGKSEVVTSL
jgi:hypothetical protein